MTLNQLNDLATELSISVVHSRICANAISMASSNSCMIVIKNEIERNKEKEKVILAEELGHCVNQAWYNNFGDPQFDRYKVKIAEGRAKVYKIKHLVDIDELLEALNLGNTEFSDLCEYFHLPADVMNEVLEYYDDHPAIIEYKNNYQEE